ncbi:MAG: hypothetical protein A2275_13490 [Bacteroidetes bacterium RIFOXYA12_FULL_35_11]|nr:MAG: hypothetical protein A2X01_20435 [Bacteroidetes bacterium GWF2_35_48]OFY81681.1 MAG: hypothetical protein A2275_13490 [Bacteroidetes bacterium RIFOXYA12_FULL_35_11]OFY93669.1 MAG: hypothetical protein A2491_00880 [Bacteroidetes bacterium RIFOXYC12_FULL_35_7]OFY96383.1 MAG: hypothetical protein A2309_01985 [Bacteroidetes bacterium RIFOXYB2_FULL_35_7]HBX50255.1 tRNA (adenosine(37)-N6)-methyltransferase TrmM [Bacteroidales bacterium]
MGNSFFRFKQFVIHHGKSAMKVGTDGVLLGAWTDFSKSTSVLDIGTGSGLIAVMAAQRCNAFIDAVEIDAPSYFQAVENAANCPWSEQIKIIHAFFQEFASMSEKKYDHIISNPPFFINFLKSAKAEKNLSCHNDLLPFPELIEGVIKLLDTNGKFSIILPVQEGELFIKTAQNASLFLNRKTMVYPCPWKPASRFLMEFSFNRIEVSENNLTIELNERHEYSDEYKKLTEEFYLNF